MGASFNTMTCAPILDEKGVRKEFEDARETDRYENGHSYSGGFGMARGLKFRNDLIFPNEEAGTDWLQNNAQKWEEAIVVRFIDKNGIKEWLIGAWCSS